MSHRVLIQQERGQFLNANAFNAWQGFEERGYEVEFATWDGMRANLLPNDPAIVTVGSVGFVRHALGRLGVRPSPLDYPDSLRSFLGRALWQTTWREIRARVQDGGSPVFVKPFEADKAFPGTVVTAFRDLIPTARWPDSMPLWAADVLLFAAEWRYFVRHHDPIAVGFSKGDPLLTPDPAVVRAAIAAYTPSAPVAYAIDFGVVVAGGTYLVEVNDGFSLGCHGLGPLAYSGFLADRWHELVATTD